MADSKWRARAHRVIHEALVEWATSQGVGLIPFISYDEAHRKAALKAISDAYPFGERSGWPYKAWLAEVREFRRKAKWDPEPAATPVEGEGLFEERA